MLALVFVLASLVLRGGSPRHAELMVITAGLATLSIALVASVGALFGAFSSAGGADERLPARLLGAHRAAAPAAG